MICAGDPHRRFVGRSKNHRAPFNGRQIAYMTYDYLWVVGVHDNVLDYADLFTVALRSDDVQEFDARWDEILLSMTKFH